MGTTIYLLEVQTQDSAWSRANGTRGTWTESHEYTNEAAAIAAAETLTIGGTAARVRDRLTGEIVWPTN